MVRPRREKTSVGSPLGVMFICCMAAMEFPAKKPATSAMGRHNVPMARNSGRQFCLRKVKVVEISCPKSRTWRNWTGAAFCMVGEDDEIIDDEGERATNDQQCNEG